MLAPTPWWLMHSTEAAAEWQQRVGAYSQLPALIRQLGGDPDPVLRRAGLRPDELADPQSTVPYAALGAVLREAAADTHCAHIGLLAGRMWRLADLGMLGDLVVNCPTVGEALRTLTVYQQLNAQGGLAFVLQRDGVVDLGYAIYHPSVTGTDQIYDAALAAAMNFMRELCGAEWNPSEVFVPHTKPPAFALFRNLFRTHLRFDAEMCALRFPEAWMQHPLPNYDRRRARVVRLRADRAARERGRLLEQVCRALRLVMVQGMTSGDDVAQMLSMHRRTLNRRLQREGVTFQNVLDGVRFCVAREMLGMSQLSLDDIAATLGYAGVSPFMRAFHRWTGRTAGQWRRAVQRGESIDDHASVDPISKIDRCLDQSGEGSSTNGTRKAGPQEIAEVGEGGGTGSRTRARAR